MSRLYAHPTPTFHPNISQASPGTTAAPAPTNAVGGDTVSPATAAGGTTAAPAPTKAAGGYTVSPATAAGGATAALAGDSPAVAPAAAGTYPRPYSPACNVNW